MLESVVSSRTRTIKLFNSFTASIPTVNVIWLRGSIGKPQVLESHSSSRSRRRVLSCGKHHIHQQNYTLSSWHWDNYCLLSTSLVPPKWWYKLTAAPVWRKKRKLRRERERKGRYGTEQHCSHQPTGGGPNRKKQQPLSGSLLKPPHYPGLHAAVAKRQRSQQCQASHSEFTSRCTVSTLFKLVKSWYTEKWHQTAPLFRPVTLFVMELEVALSSKIAEKKQTGQEGGGTSGLCTEGTLLFQFSRKYVGVASDSFPAGNSHVLGSTFFFFFPPSLL